MGDANTGGGAAAGGVPASSSEPAYGGVHTVSNGRQGGAWFITSHAPYSVQAVKPGMDEAAIKAILANIADLTSRVTYLSPKIKVIVEEIFKREEHITCIGGRMEVCKTGRIHFQGIVLVDTRMGKQQIKKLVEYPGVDWHIGTHEGKPITMDKINLKNASDYCKGLTKGKINEPTYGAEYFQFGEMVAGHGGGRGLNNKEGQTVLDQIKDGAEIKDVLEEHPEYFFKHAPTIRQAIALVNPPKERPNPTIHFFFGPPNTGKSAAARALADRLVGTGKSYTFSGFSGSSGSKFHSEEAESAEAWIFNDTLLSDMGKPAEILKLFDREPNTGSIRGASFNIKAHVFIITGNYAQTEDGIRDYITSSFKNLAETNSNSWQTAFGAIYSRFSPQARGVVVGAFGNPPQLCTSRGWGFMYDAEPRYRKWLASVAPAGSPPQKKRIVLRTDIDEEHVQEPPGDSAFECSEILKSVAAEERREAAVHCSEGCLPGVAVGLGQVLEAAGDVVADAVLGLRVVAARQLGNDDALRCLVV